MENGFIGVIVCGAVAVLLLAVGARDGALVWRLRRHGIRTWGVVVDNVRVERRDTGPSWAPVIAFADLRGHRVEFTTRMRGGGMGLATGRRVPVVYLAHDPQGARVSMWRHTVGPVVFALLAGLVFAGAAVLVAVTA
ncbi:hypothetical protein SAMN04490357_6597 [Streptomyces misionensis]|uniref:DUF3592 domain-containing protein n=1 Tax=Streptomyces misionensis TaxID=67331 RepID=A0A1H5FBH4_9ACTN|nr:DUF3592 domain-containing protein [Streptomyces misionensis]SEE00468.1 hypothetical protein SAMN04490357_6597 [Streptomyces misionensis]